MARTFGGVVGLKLLLATVLGVALAAGRAAARPPVRIGLFEPDLPGSLAATDAAVQRIGRRPAVAAWFEAWSNARPPDVSRLTAIRAAGYAPLITWEPWDPAAGPAQDAYCPARIAAGEHDAYLRAWGRGLAAVDGLVLVRFAHEMNGGWYPWGAGHAAPEQYVRAFRHVVDVLRAAGAANARFVWAPNVAFPGSAPLAPLYPGDAYVDWVCLDGFNWGASQPDRRWQRFVDVFEPTYREAARVAPGKPFMLETASSSAGGDKAAWVRDALAALPGRFPRVELLLWFDQAKETDWPIGSPPAALDAFRAGVAGPRYADGPLP